MKKISEKVIILAGLTMLIVSVLLRLVLKLLLNLGFREPITEDLMFLGGIFAVTISIFTFTFVVNQVIVKRIKQLDKATVNIKEGNYDFTIDASGHDEITRLSENFNLMTQELQSNEYLNKEFVRNFSHEFKTPLSVIRGYAEMVDEMDLSDVEKKEYLSIIISETQRLSNLTNNMLQISLIDSKAIINKDDEYSFSEQVRNVIQMTQLKWEEKKLSFDLDMDEIKIINNKELTYQIVLNLLSNAVKYSNFKEKIKITLKDSTDSFTFSITNKGQEIPKKDFEKVFQLFYISDKENNQESTGVGLTLTKRIVDKLKGKITFDSDKGVTTFIVSLTK